MPVHTVSELLRRPFDDLELKDVRDLLSFGDEGESLFFERKSELRPDLLAKSCAAFANTMGGLLVVGVADRGEEIAGVEPPSAEPQVWVKDALRPRVVPLPPFRARQLQVSDDGRVVLLVLVEQSSSTPHLLTRQGAIYVRNPGSSDPLPIGDQRRLHDLQQRGIESREKAVRRARDAAARRPVVLQFDYPARRALSLSLAATGVADWFEQRLLGTPHALSALNSALPVPLGRSSVRERWAQHSVQVHRVYEPQNPFNPSRAELVEVSRDGVVLLQGGYVHRVDEDFEALAYRDSVTQWIARAFGAGRTLLLGLGAHGDLRLVVRVFAPVRIEWRGSYPDVNQDINVEMWTGLDLDEARESEGLMRVEVEIGRALGIAPPAPESTAPTH